MRVDWAFFGLPSSAFQDSNIVANLFINLAVLETNGLYYSLTRRLVMIDLIKKHTQIFKQEISDGLSEEAAMAFASRKLLLEVVKDDGAYGRGIQDDDIIDFIRNFDTLTSRASRWQVLLDAIGVPEILLMHSDDDDETNIPDDIPIPDIELVSNEEYHSLREKLLSPTLGLEETCLKLSGVVHMIQRLRGLERSELRTFLTQEIRRRVKDVLGDSEDSEDEPFDNEDDSAEEGAEQSHDLDGAALDSALDTDFSANFYPEFWQKFIQQDLFSFSPTTLE
jgi:hypothetical protein